VTNEINKSNVSSFLPKSSLMNQKLLFSVLLIFSTSFVFSNETKITGLIPGGENLEIRLLAYSDMLTYTEEILDRCIVDSSGSFSFSVDITETIIAFIDIEFYQSSIFLEPGFEYKISCDTISVSDEFRPYYQKDPLIYYMVSGDTSQLNLLIAEFDNTFNVFLLENFEEIYKRRKKSLIFNFRDTIENRFETVENDYFKNYINYKFGSIELAATSVEKPELFMKYFNGKPIMLNNVEYMNFFNQFFKRYITVESRVITRSDLNNTININCNYLSLLDTLGKDTLLRNERLRELVLLKGLTELYNSPDYSNENILKILNEVASESNYPDHRKIALNYLKSLTKLQKGTLAPQFLLSNLEGDTISLSDYLDKPVYLSFMTTWSYGCLAEFKLLDSLYRDYGKEISLITISFDKQIETLKRFVEDKNYNWTFLYNGLHYNILKDYNIRTFPMFVLISSEGKILQYPAYKPSEYISENFERLIKQKSRE